MKKSRIILIIALAALLASALAACNHEHQYNIKTQEPTCTEPGWSQGECTICSEKSELEVLPPLGHAFATDGEGHSLWTYDSAKHWHECTREGCGAHEDEDDHTLDGDKKCTVCGFETYSYAEAGEGYILTAYNGDESAVSIPATYDNKPVTGIGERVFYQNSKLETLTLPASITSIARDAFLDASSLKRVNTASLEAWLGIKFENYAANPMHTASELYFGQTKLGSTLEIPAATTEINAYAFYGVGTIEELTIHQNVGRIGYRAFEGAFAPATTADKLSKDVIVKIDDLQKWCAIEFSKDMLDLDRCTANPLYYEATLMVGEEPVEGAREFDFDISAFAFYGYDKLTSVTCSGSVGQYAFAKCGELASVTLSGATDIPNGLFAHCGKLAEAHIDSAESIGLGAFEECGRLASISLPSVAKIADNAFYKCSSLAQVTSADNLVRVGELAFYDTALLTSADGAEAEAVYVGNVLVGIKGSFDSEAIDGGKLSVRQGTVAIADGALSNVAYLGSVTLPDSLKFIGKNAFRYTDLVRSSLTEIDLGGAEEIGENAFAGNNLLDSISIPASVTSIGRNAFLGCDGLMGVYTPDLAAWMEIAFANAQANPVAFAHNLYIGDPQDEDLESVDTVTIAAGKTTVGQFVFYGLNTLQSVVLPAGLESIGQGAFESSSYKNIYFEGETEEDYAAIEIPQNALLGTVYYFSESEPEFGGSYWHYSEEDHTPTLW